MGKATIGADEGFSLIEVIMALLLLGIVATSALYFFVSGTRSTTNAQRTQNAVAVANEAMERAYALDPKDSVLVANTSGMVLGRTKASVESAWSSAVSLSIEGAADTYPLWDSTATAASVPVMPLSYTRHYSGIDYTVTTLVGSCFRPSTALVAEQTCGRLSGISSDPGDAATPATMVRMLRIIAYVTWEPTAGECAGSVCTFQLSGLVDRSNDLKWNQLIEPVAVDDFEGFVQGQMSDIDVMANDMIGPIAASPVTIISPPAAGTAVAKPTGLITYTAPSSPASGIYTFTYRLKDARGELSAPATVQITVPPIIKPDDFNVSGGVSTPLAVTANDNGTYAQVVIDSPPSKGTATVSGLNVVYTPSIASGQDTFTYHFVDTSGQPTGPAIVTVTVSTLIVSDKAVDVPMRLGSGEEWTDLTALLKQGVPDPDSVQIVIEGLASNKGMFRVDGANRENGIQTGTTISYSPERNQLGEFAFQYSLRNSMGVESLPRRSLIIRVVPVANADAYGTYQDGRTIELFLGSNDRPTVFSNSVSAVNASQADIVLGTLSPGCGQFSVSQSRYTSGYLRIDLPNYASSPTDTSCSFTYYLRGRGALTALRSADATVTFKVNR